MARSLLADRLLAEWVCRIEQDAGHPQACAAADAAAIRGGGDFGQRILARARALPDADAKLQAIRRMLRFATGLALLLSVLALLSGAAAASAALGATVPASLPLVLLAVVGTNLAMLLLWLLAQILGWRVAPGIGALLRLLSGLYARRSAADSGSGALLQLLGTSASGRWFAAVTVHAAWLGFALGALLALAVLLSVRAYELSWATTLLSERALGTWAQALSLGPALIGMDGAGTLPVDDLSAAPVRQAWSWWLLAAVTVYGVLPRALALLLTALLLWRSLRAIGSDLARPGYARLRARLLPDHADLGIVDAAPPEHEAQAATRLPPAGDRMHGRVHGLALEADGATQAPALPGVDWIWLGAVDDSVTRGATLQRLRSEPVQALAICVRATLTPDRGIERYIRELIAAARAPTTLVLGALDRLHARGPERYAQRLQDWQALAARAGTAVQRVEPAST
jgi:hypothetical protein